MMLQANLIDHESNCMLQYVEKGLKCGEGSNCADLHKHISQIINYY